MPAYDYKCEQCETTFELSLSFDNKDMQYCEDCEKPLVRIYAAVAKANAFIGGANTPAPAVIDTPAGITPEVAALLAQLGAQKQ